MATVNIKPMSQSLRETPVRFRHMTPPIFTDGPATEEDVELARELFEALDEESKEWYGGRGSGGLFEGL